MSSLRNAIQRRNHRERAQPLERKKWGLLEKHKDYSARAADHNLKKRKLSALKSKARERNEDEFYFGMMSSETVGGVKRAKRGEENAGGGGKVLDAETVKLMKTQDEGYLRTVLQSTKRERERVEEEVVVGEKGVSVAVPAEAAKGRLVFGEDGEDMVAPVPVHDANIEDLTSEDDGEDKGAQETTRLSKEEQALRKKRRRALEVKQRHLEMLQDREEHLTAALREVEAQRARMNGTAGGINKNGVKFKPRQRKR